MMKVMIAGIWVTAKIGDNFMRSKSSSNSDILQISSSYYVSLLFGSQSKDQIIMGFFLNIQSNYLQYSMLKMNQANWAWTPLIKT